MGEKGLVINVKDHLAVIQMTRKEACAECRARSCLAGMKKEEMIIEAENECDAKVGDWVIMELRNNSFIKAVLILYGISLLCGLLAIFISFKDSRTAVVVILTIIVLSFLIYYFNAHIKNKNQ